MEAQLRQEIGKTEPTQGLTMTALLALPDPLRNFLAWMVRRHTVPLDEVSGHLDQAQDVCQQLLSALQEKGLVRMTDRGGEPLYQVWLSLEGRRSNSPDILRVLED
jgi:hypothetical protein